MIRNGHPMSSSEGRFLMDVRSPKCSKTTGQSWAFRDHPSCLPESYTVGSTVVHASKSFPNWLKQPCYSQQYLPMARSAIVKVATQMVFFWSDMAHHGIWISFACQNFCPQRGDPWSRRHLFASREGNICGSLPIVYSHYHSLLWTYCVAGFSTWFFHWSNCVPATSFFHNLAWKHVMVRSMFNHCSLLSTRYDHTDDLSITVYICIQTYETMFHH